MITLIVMPHTSPHEALQYSPVCVTGAITSTRNMHFTNNADAGTSTVPTAIMALAISIQCSFFISIFTSYLVAVATIALLREWCHKHANNKSQVTRAKTATDGDPYK